MQIRYYADDNQEQNYPKDVKKSDLVSGRIFQQYFPITNIRIEAMPGTKFYINNGIKPIYMNPKGIYELRDTRITKLNFDIVSLEKINQNDKQILLIEGL